jgi:hypothetical protein
LADINTALGAEAAATALKATPMYQDNGAQTQFWSNFIADSNNLGDRVVALAQSDDAAAKTQLIADLNAFETNASNFDAAQGGIFGARFDNELLGNKGTIGADVAAAIKAIQTGDANLANAVQEALHGNAADVGGNNIPSVGGMYNGDAKTAQDALPAGTDPKLAQPVQAPAPAPVVAHDRGNHGQVDHMADFAQHFQQMHHWG